MGISGFIDLSGETSKEAFMQTMTYMHKTPLAFEENRENVFINNNCVMFVDGLSGSSLSQNEEKNIVVAFAGELYNSREIAEDFCLNGNTENRSFSQIILKAYEDCGIEFFNRLNGSYVFIIYDARKEKVLFCRDRIGEKSLYYYHNEKKVVFSTTLIDILNSRMVRKEIDKVALTQYLQLTYIPAPRSILVDVKKLMAATTLKISNDGNAEEKTYWTLDVEQARWITDYDEAKRQLKENLFTAVEKRMAFDGSTGSFLSGGFDSTIVLGIMSKISNQSIDAFTIGFDEKSYDETSLASIVAKKHNAKHHIVHLNEQKAMQAIEDILENMDEPYGDSSLIATYLVAKEAKQNVNAALMGDAGDELFAGYNKYLIGYYNQKYQKVPKCIKNGLIKPFARLLPVRSTLARKANKFLAIAEKEVFEQRKQLMSLGFKKSELVQLMNDVSVDNMDFMYRYYNELKNTDEQTKAQYLDLKVVLEGDMARKTERAGVMAAFTTRAPLLDRNIVELAYRIPTKYKIDGKKRKIILKDTFKDLIPQELFKAPKHGFAVPISIWMDSFLGDRLKSVTTKEFLARQGLFDYDYIQRTIQAHVDQKENRDSELWTFYVFQEWYIRYIES